MLAVGIIMDILIVGGILLWVLSGIWLAFAIGFPIAIALGAWVSVYYCNHSAYICPECHTVFKPSFKQIFFARHTPSTRRLTCTSCGYRGFCIETYSKSEKRRKNRRKIYAFCRSIYGNGAGCHSFFQVSAPAVAAIFSCASVGFLCQRADQKNEKKRAYFRNNAAYFSVAFFHAFFLFPLLAVHTEDRK